MSKLARNSWLSRTIVATLALGVTSARADSALLLDDFSTTDGTHSAVVIGPPVTSTDSAVVRDFVPTLKGGVRETMLHVYKNLLASASAVAVGANRLSVAQGTGAIAETILSYGAFTRPSDPNTGGPLLGLDLRKYNTLQLDFLGSEDALNLSVTFYTSAPLDPGDPQYYTTAGLNLAPTTPGAALSAKLPIGADADFNWEKVDGVTILINRSGPTPSTSYTLERVSFVNSKK